MSLKLKSYSQLITKLHLSGSHMRILKYFLNDDSQIDYLKSVCSLFFLMRKQILLENSSVYYK